MKDWPFDLQLFSAGVDESEFGYEDEPETEEPETETAPEALTPEQENAKLREQVASQGKEIDTFRSVIDEIKSRPVERIIERSAPAAPAAESPEDRSRRSADLAIRLGTDPESVLNEVAQRAETRAKRAILDEAGEDFGDTIIERFERKRMETVPLIGDKVRTVFRKALDELGPNAKKALVLMPPAERNAALELHWKAATGEYLEPKIKPKVKGTAATDMGGRTAGAAPGPRATKGFSFTDSQKESMRRAGLTNEKIAAREKAIREGLT